MTRHSEVLCAALDEVQRELDEMNEQDLSRLQRRTDLTIALAALQNLLGLSPHLSHERRDDTSAATTYRPTDGPAESNDTIKQRILNDLAQLEPQTVASLSERLGVDKQKLRLLLLEMINVRAICRRRRPHTEDPSYYYARSDEIVEQWLASLVDQPSVDDDPQARDADTAVTQAPCTEPEKPREKSPTSVRSVYVPPAGSVARELLGGQVRR